MNTFLVQTFVLSAYLRIVRRSSYTCRVKSLHLSIALVPVILLFGCTRSVPPNSSSLSAVNSSSSSDHSEFLQLALNAEYSIASNSVRQIYSAAGKNFHISLTNGLYQATDRALLQPFDSVRLRTDFVAFGILHDSTDENLVTALDVGSQDNTQLEIVVLSRSGGLVSHTVSYPLGHAELQSLTIRSGFIHVVISHRLPSDPGPRVSEFVLHQ